MIVLYIILGLLAVIGLLLTVPIRVFGSVKDNVNLSVKFLFWNINILPSKKSKEAEPAKQSENAKKIIGKNGAFSTIKELFSVAKMLFGRVVWILRKVRIDRLEALITVADDDAAKTGIEYGATCSLVYPAVGFLGTFTDISHTNVSVVADFDSAESKIELDGEISLRLVWAVMAAVSALWQYIKIKSSQ